MSVLDLIQDRVSTISSEKGLSDDRAFAYWFLEDIEELSEEEAEVTILDGPWDGGRDAVYFDEENKILKIYQFKYSQDNDYLMSAFRDLQRGVQNEAVKLSNSEELKLYIVSIATANEEIHLENSRSRKRIRTWLTRNGFRINADIEIFDLKKFAQLFEKIYGVDTTIDFKVDPVITGDAILGLLDASLLSEFIDREELLAFNIRKFLGIRKGSVNWQIRQTLEEEEDRNRFWILNNGIVCLCTEFTPVADKRISFSNFTIVNGAQTINTIARFLQDNPAIQEPIWVFGKIIRVSEDNIEYAIELTKTSNTQTPTNNKDLRAVDVSHKRIKLWFYKYFDLDYIFRRGERITRGVQAVSMKDLAQSYIAYWHEEPHISFGRPGKLFADSNYYDLVFPGSDIDELFRSGSDGEIEDFLSKRLLPFNMLIKIKENLVELTLGDTEKKWKSLSYHILWIYRMLFEKESLNDINILLNKYEDIIATTMENIFDSISDFCLTNRIEVPRDFKSHRLAKEIRERHFIDTRAIRRARAEITALVNEAIR